MYSDFTFDPDLGVVNRDIITQTIMDQAKAYTYTPRYERTLNISARGGVMNAGRRSEKGGEHRTERGETHTHNF